MTELHLFFCYSWMSLKCLIYLWQIYIFIPLDPWLFFKVLNKVNFTALSQAWVISYYWHTPAPFKKLLEFLAINYSLFERRIIFVPWLLKFSMFWLFYNLMGVHFPAVQLDNVIQFSTLSRMSRFLWQFQMGPLVRLFPLTYARAWSVCMALTVTMWLLYSSCALPWTTK